MALGVRDITKATCRTRRAATCSTQCMHPSETGALDVRRKGNAGVSDLRSDHRRSLQWGTQSNLSLRLRLSLHLRLHLSVDLRLDLRPILKPKPNPLEPSWSEKPPMGHAVHAEDPACDEKLPKLHSVQKKEDSKGEYLPAGPDSSADNDNQGE